MLRDVVGSIKKSGGRFQMIHFLIVNDSFHCSEIGSRACYSRLFSVGGLLVNVETANIV